MRPRVYVAGPLGTGPERQANVDKAVAAGIALLQAGYAPLIPHLTHYIDPDESIGYDAWIESDLAWIMAADFVLRLPGKSPGADREVELARTLHIPVVPRLAYLRARYAPAMSGR